MSNTKRRKFYRSDAWAQFVARLRLERATDDGLLICEHCGKPIVRKYDCIAHHVDELTEDNVDDVTVALNPDNIKLVHFRCHNEIHERFGFGFGSGGRSGARVRQEVYIVWGSPCSGKTTWVSQVAESSDIILDMDKLWAAIRADCCGVNDKPDQLKMNVFGLRDAMIDMIRVRQGKWKRAYIIGGYPLEGERERLADLVGADRVVFIECDKNICLERAKFKGGKWTEFVENWWERFNPGPPPSA